MFLYLCVVAPFFFFFFFNDTATTEIYTLSLHDALPIFRASGRCPERCQHRWRLSPAAGVADRKSTRLNSSHSQISYAVFCLKKKKKIHGTYGLFQPIPTDAIVHYQYQSLLPTTNTSSNT